MDREYLLAITADFMDTSPANYLRAADIEEETRARLPEGFFEDLRFYLPPLLSVGAADDPGFLKLKEPGVVGPHHMLPMDWLPEAKTVISLFLPFTDRIIQSNVHDPKEPSWEWLFGPHRGSEATPADRRVRPRRPP